jgi:uncharacterized protein YcbX
MRIGTLGELWRYPVKSMAGERIERTSIGVQGIPGDRGWAVRDEVRGGIRGGKKLPGLMRCSARYPERSTDERARPAEITLPDSSSFMTNAPDANRHLSAALGHEVTLWPLVPADKLEHYRRGAPDHADLEQELRAIFALEPNEPLPDLSKLPSEVFEFESPPGTYFDAYPLLVVTDASVRKLQALAPDCRIDVRRFRPNLLISCDGRDSSFVEQRWIGRRLRVGAAVLAIASACPRCVMTTLPFDDLPHEPKIMRTLVRETSQNFGVYATVATPGLVAVGDEIELLD